MTDAPVPVDRTSMKPGIRTTEFWLKLLAVLIAAVMPMLPVGSNAIKIVTVISVVLGALGYAGFRTWAKVATSKDGEA